MMSVEIFSRPGLKMLENEGYLRSAATQIFSFVVRPLLISRTILSVIGLTGFVAI